MIYDILIGLGVLGFIVYFAWMLRQGMRSNRG